MAGEQEAAPRSLEEIISDVVTYHRPSDRQVEDITAIREAVKKLIFIIATRCPNGPDRSAAIRKAREAMMTANASIVVPQIQI